jgi:hypothetical protein
MLIAINADTLEVTEQSGTAVAVAELGGVAYFVEPTRVAAQSAGAPVQFDAYIRTGDIALVRGMSATPHPAYLMLEANGPMTLTAHRAELPPNIYVVPDARSAKVRYREVPMGKGASAPEWSFEIGSAAGRHAKWALSEISIAIAGTKRPK